MNIPESLADIQEQVIKREISLVQICQEYINRIKSSSSNAFIEVFEEEALLKAEEIQKKIISNNFGLLAGIFLGLKDNISYENHKLTASSKMLEGFKSLFSANVWA